MSEGIVVALISAVVAVLVALIGLLTRVSIKVTRVARDAAETREQVANNHIDEDGNPINLREEADERHGENSGKLDALAAGQDAILEEIRNLRSSDRKQWARLNIHTDAIHELEITQPSRFAPQRPGRHREEPPS